MKYKCSQTYSKIVKYAYLLIFIKNYKKLSNNMKNKDFPIKFEKILENLLNLKK